jgi:hypothetical protein
MSTTRERLLPQPSEDDLPSMQQDGFGTSGSSYEFEATRLRLLEQSDPAGAAFSYVDHASIFLHEGEHYLKFRFHPTNYQQRKHFRFLHFSRYNWVKMAEMVVASVLLLLTLFEPPAVYLWPPYATVPVELFCVLFFIWDVNHRSKAAGGYRVWLRHYGHVLRLLGIIALLLDMIIALATKDQSRPLRMVNHVSNRHLHSSMLLTGVNCSSDRFSSLTPSTARLCGGLCLISSPRAC